MPQLSLPEVKVQRCPAGAKILLKLAWARPACTVKLGEINSLLHWPASPSHAPSRIALVFPAEMKVTVGLPSSNPTSGKTSFALLFNEPTHNRASLFVYAYDRNKSEHALREFISDFPSVRRLRRNRTPFGQIDKWISLRDICFRYFEYVALKLWHALAHHCMRCRNGCGYNRFVNHVCFLAADGSQCPEDRNCGPK
jgi:hypothetical protein